jgi:hypothetical protein
LIHFYKRKNVKHVRGENMAYTFQPLEAALDSLGVSYTDGVTVKIADKYTVKCDLGEVESLLQNTDPKTASLHADYDSAFENQVLQDLQRYREEKKKRTEIRKQRIRDFDTRREEEKERKRKEEEERALEDERLHLEEIEREKEKAEALEKERREKEEEEEKERMRKEEERTRHEEEVEWKRFEEERARSESISRKQTGLSRTCSTESNPEPAPPCDTQTPPLPTNLDPGVSEPTGDPKPEPEPEPKPYSQPKPDPDPPVINKPNKPVKINFSDFEAEADVFADLVNAVS